MARRSREYQLQPWTDADNHLRYTVDLLMAAQAGRLGSRPIATVFPPSIAVGEVMVGQAGYHLSEFIAVGDGTYQHSTMVVGGSGVLGLTLLAGTLAGSAIANSNRRAAAQEAATRRWRHIDSGGMAISTAGFYFNSTLGLRPWAWEHVTSAMVVEQSTVQLQGNSTTGKVSWLIQSPCAELLFALWAVHRHPQHPQLCDGSWLPTGWIEHATAHGHWPPLPPHEPDPQVEQPKRLMIAEPASSMDAPEF